MMPARQHPDPGPRAEDPDRTRPHLVGRDDAGGAPSEALPLLERERELEQLEGLLQAAAAGRAGTVFVESAAGLGKTALLRWLRDRAAALGFRTFEASPDEPDRHVPFEALGALLERLLGTDARGEGAGPAPDAHALGHRAVDALRRLAAETPVLLTVDDAHWADPASLSVLVTLVRRAHDCPLLVALAARPNEPPAGDAILAQLAADPDTHLLRPKPLSVDAARALVRRTLGDEAGERMCAACHDVTAGNPFLLRQLLKELEDEAVDVQNIDRDEVQRLTPRSISRAVLVRLARLTPDAVDVCRAAAVLGGQGSLASVAALAGLPPVRAARAADALAQVAIFRRSLGFSFVHPIVRSAVLADLPPHERATLHAGAVRILRDAGAAPAALAAHLVHVEPEGDAAAVEVLLDAARGALRQGLPADAAAYLRRALDEPPPAALRRQVVEELARAELHRDPATALELLEGVEGGGDLEEVLRARRTRAEALLALGRARDAIALLDEVVAEAREAGRCDVAALCEAQLVTVARLDLDTRGLSLDRGARLQDAAGDSDLARVLALGNAAVEEGLRGADLWRTVELAEGALADGRLVAQGDARLACGVAVALAWADRPADGADVLRGVAARADREADPRARVLATALLGQVAHRTGDLRRAADLAHEALVPAGASGWRPGVVIAAAVLLDVLVERGALDEADALLAEHGLDGELPAAWSSIALHATRARLRLERNDPDGARRDAERSLELLAAFGAPNPAITATREVHVLALHALEDPPASGGVAPQATPPAAAPRQARPPGGGDGRPALSVVPPAPAAPATTALRLAQAAVAHAEAWGARSAHGRALRVLARVVDGAAAPALLHESLERLSSSPARLELARTHADLGGALRRAGQRAEARTHLSEALALAEACGAEALAELARTELRALGVRRRREDEGGRSELTASEQRVAELVAEGLTNREIAQRLFVTLKTVEAHLTNTYRKLGIRSRTELVRWVGQDRG